MGHYLKNLNNMNRLESIHLVSELDNLEKLQEFEINHFQIPNSFKDYLINYNVAKPRKSYYKQDLEFNLNYLFGFSPYSYEDFIHIIKTYTNRMDEDLFPIGSIDGGDLLCMSKSTEEIFYWNHEIDDRGLEGNETIITKISKNINDFLENLILSSEPTEYEIQQSIKNSKVLYTSDDFDELFAKYLIDDPDDKKSTPYKTLNGRDFTKEEWEAYEAEEYRKYIEKKNKKSFSFFASEDKTPENFSVEMGKLQNVEYIVFNSRGEQVPVYQYPSTMVAPISFLDNGTAIQVLKYEKDDWCEVLSKNQKKGYIQSSFVKKNS